MIVSREREKLINAIIYFVRKTKHCHTLKLFKLLNFLDFEHYRQTGRTVTGSRYVAWPQGPAPNSLWHEIEDGGAPDLTAAISILPIRDDVTDKLLRRDLKPRRAFNSKIFTPRELEIMDRLVLFFKEAEAGDMSGVSHSQGLPWRRVYQKGRGEGQEIHPDLALEADPIIHDAPTIDSDELEYRREILEDLP